MSGVTKRICVVGAGVIGLSAAYLLRKFGHSVKIVAASTPDQHRVSSAVAAAFWYPYHVQGPKDGRFTVRALAESTLDWFLEFARQPNLQSGIAMQKGVEYFDELAIARNVNLPWWSTRRELQVDGLTGRELPPASALLGSFSEGICFRLPVIHMPTYLRYLQNQIGAIQYDQNGDPQPKVIEQRTITDLNRVDEEGSYDCIVNCTGIGAAQIASDPDLYPLQGQLVVVPEDKVEIVRRVKKLVFIQSGMFENEPLYIVPRPTHGDVVLGGTVVDLANGSSLRSGFDESDNKYWEPDPTVGRRILNRCSEIRPELRQFSPDDAELRIRYMMVGLRPCRSHLRIELDRTYRTPVIHNYGHGGGGVTLSWGSALEVEKLLRSF